MKQWRETAAILDRITLRGPSAEACALATIVGITGSSYRRSGAKLLVEVGGGTLGGVSGGCLESDVRELAARVVRSGRPMLRHYDTSDGESAWGLGVGCDGAVDIFIQPLGTGLRDRIVPRVAALMRAGRTFALITALSGEGAGCCALADGDGVLHPEREERWTEPLADQLPRIIENGANRLLGSGPQSVFVEVFVPPPQLLVFGAGDDALPLVRLAIDVGFTVTVVDHRPAYLDPERFPPSTRRVLRRSEDGLGDLRPGARDFAVVLTHSLAHDRAWVAALRRTGIAYLGLLGSRKRVRDVLGEVGATDAGRIFAPVGLDLGADGPEQVAVSVIAELLAVQADRAPDHLRARKGAIHGQEESGGPR